MKFFQVACYVLNAQHITHVCFHDDEKKPATLSIGLVSGAFINLEGDEARRGYDRLMKELG